VRALMAPFNWRPALRENAGRIVVFDSCENLQSVL